MLVKPPPVEESVETDENLVSLDIQELIEKNKVTFGATIDVEGKIKHKASMIREFFK